MATFMRYCTILDMYDNYISFMYDTQVVGPFSDNPNLFFGAYSPIIMVHHNLLYDIVYVCSSTIISFTGRLCGNSTPSNNEQ